METPTVAADKKKPRLGAHIVFADESGFLLLPHVAKTWLRSGKLRFIVMSIGATKFP
jgi:hypothetical protein